MAWTARPARSQARRHRRADSPIAGVAAMVAGDVQAGRQRARSALDLHRRGARHRQRRPEQQLAHRRADRSRQQADQRPRPRQQAVRLQREPRRDGAADVIADPAEQLRVRERIAAARLLQIRAPSIQQTRGVGDRRAVGEGAERVRGALEGVLAVGAQRLAIALDQRRGVANRVQRQAGRRDFETKPGSVGSTPLKCRNRSGTPLTVRRSRSAPHRALAQVPVGDVPAVVAQDGDAGEQPGREVQPFLVDEQAALDLRHALELEPRLPPAQEGVERRLPPHREETEVVGAGLQDRRARSDDRRPRSSR